MPHPTPIPPLPGQDSVWLFPRPAVAEPTSSLVRIVFAGETIVETRRAVRVIETSHPPSYYVPPADIRPDCLVPTGRRSLCEWKGQAGYFDLVVGAERAPGAAWAYAAPTPAFAIIKDHVAFYPRLMEACFVDGERVIPQDGPFYGGWITSHVAGPFKGPPGTEWW